MAVIHLLFLPTIFAYNMANSAPSPRADCSTHLTAFPVWATENFTEEFLGFNLKFLPEPRVGIVLDGTRRPLSPTDVFLAGKAPWSLKSQIFSNGDVFIVGGYYPIEHYTENPGKEVEIMLLFQISELIEHLSDEAEHLTEFLNGLERMIENLAPRDTPYYNPVTKDTLTDLVGSNFANSNELMHYSFWNSDGTIDASKTDQVQIKLKAIKQEHELQLYPLVRFIINLKLYQPLLGHPIFTRH